MIGTHHTIEWELPGDDEPCILTYICWPAQFSDEADLFELVSCELLDGTYEVLRSSDEKAAYVWIKDQHRD